MTVWRSFLWAGALALGIVAPLAPAKPPALVKPPLPLPPVIIEVDPQPPQIIPIQAEVPELPVVNDGFADDQDVKGPLKPLLDKLRSQVFVEREDATRTLLSLPPGRLDEVVKALSAETDAEALERLTRVVAHLYLKPRTVLKSPASILGLRYQMAPVRLAPQDTDLTMTVLVVEIQPGFPAMQTLRNGDRIVTIDDKAFPPDIPESDNVYFPARVATLTAGAVVKMQVLRDGKVIPCTVQVAGQPKDQQPDTYVRWRNAAVDAFLRTLKAGDKNQV